MGGQPHGPTQPLSFQHMPETFDSVLLGRKRMPPDPRDHKLGDYLAAHERIAASLSPQTTLEQLATAGPLEAWHDVYAFWAWFKAHILGTTPPPAPPPVGAARLWPHTEPVSDQGQTGHCVGFTGLDWGNTLPVDDVWPNAKGHAIYYACKVVDGEPGAEDGSNSRSLCKVLNQMGRIGAYAFAASADEAAAYVLAHGPVGIGVDWYNDDFTPPGNVLSLKGGLAGGHEISLIGYDPATRLFTLLNHWGAGWADKGCAYLRHDDLDRLLGQGGDCWAGLEQPLAA